MHVQHLTRYSHFASCFLQAVLWGFRCVLASCMGPHKMWLSVQVEL